MESKFYEGGPWLSSSSWNNPWLMSLFTDYLLSVTHPTLQLPSAGCATGGSRRFSAQSQFNSKGDWLSSSQPPGAWGLSCSNPFMLLNSDVLCWEGLKEGCGGKLASAFLLAPDLRHHGGVWTELPLRDRIHLCPSHLVFILLLSQKKTKQNHDKKLK